MGKIYDLIVIGAGPAGITAGVYAARKKMDFLVVTKNIGGQTALSGDIENYTGYQFISGPELTHKFEEHMKKYNVPVKEEEEVKQLKKDNDFIDIETDKDRYKARTIIVASGTRWKELNVPGEKEYKNKGLSYCATCDAPLFSDKDVAVIGGGNSGLEAALQLIKIANHIYIINIARELTGDDILAEKIRKSDNITIMNNTKVIAITGDKMVSGVKIKREKEKELAVKGVFVEIGLRPNSEFVQEVDKNEKGEIKVNCATQTNVSGIFAAGDVTNIPEKQIIVAAGEGSKAALSSFRYVSRLK